RCTPVLHYFPTRRSSDLRSIVQRPSDEPFIHEAVLAVQDDATAPVRPERTVIAGSPVQGTEFLLLSLSNARLFFGPARSRLLTRDRKSTRLNSSHVAISY